MRSMATDDVRVHGDSRSSGARRSSVGPDRDCDASIVIVNWNTRDRLEGCLSSVLGATLACRFEVIVVDNGSVDGSPEMLETKFPTVRVRRNAANAGFAVACNQGMRMARGRYLVLLNSDTLVEGDAVSRLVAYMDDHPETGMGGGALLYEDGCLQPSCGRFPGVMAPVLGSVHPRRLLTLLHGRREAFGEPFLGRAAHERERSVDWIVGACMIVRKQAAQAVGLMDERIFLFAEEWDWCYRMKAAGWRIDYTPSVRVVHVGSASWTMSDTRRIRALMTGQHYFFRKNFGLLRALAFRAMTAVGSVAKLAGRGLILAGVFPSARLRSACLAALRRNFVMLHWAVGLGPQGMIRAQDIQQPHPKATPGS